MTDNTDIQSEIAELKTMLDMVRWTVTQFNRAELFYGHGTDNPWDEAVCLVLQVLDLPQSLPEQTGDQLFHSRLTATEKLAIAALVQQRVEKRIPLAYLTNQAWFCGLPFYVDERVLVPRSPFAELINQRFADWYDSDPNSVLDMCTGSACIAIALAHAFPDAQVDAIDISDDALAVAEINIIEHQLDHRVVPIKSDLYSGVRGHKYDLIVSNPPYVDAEDMGDLPDEFHHEPELGLAAGQDGLDLVDVILREAPQHLTEDGWLFVEVGNSLVYMDEKYPGLKLHWIEFEHGGLGVFAIDRASLKAYFSN